MPEAEEKKQIEPPEGAGPAVSGDSENGKPGAKKKDIGPDELSKIESMAGRGLTKEEVAWVLGMSETTFYQRQRENPQISEAFQRGRAMAKAIIGGTLFDMAKKGDFRSIKFWMSTIGGLSERRSVDVAGSVHLTFDEDDGNL